MISEEQAQEKTESWRSVTLLQGLSAVEGDTSDSGKARILHRFYAFVHSSFGIYCHRCCEWFRGPLHPPSRAVAVRQRRWKWVPVRGLCAGSKAITPSALRKGALLLSRHSLPVKRSKVSTVGSAICSHGVKSHPWKKSPVSEANCSVALALAGGGCRGGNGCPGFAVLTAGRGATINISPAPEGSTESGAPRVSRPGKSLESASVLLRSVSACLNDYNT